MIKTIYFLSKDASWQKYRYDVFDILSQRYGYDFVILTTGKVKKEFTKNKKIRYKSFYHIFKYKSKLCFYPGALFYLLNKKPDILITQGHIDLNEIIATIMCKIFSIKQVVWTHGYLHGEHSKFYRLLKKYLQKIIFKNANSIITFSEKGRQFLINRGINKKKVFHAPNTLNTNLLIEKHSHTINKYTKSEIMHRVGLPMKSKIILYCGRLQKRKKINLLLEAFSLLQNKMNNIVLVIIGDGEDKNNLMKYTKELSIEKKVIFKGSIYNEDELSLYYSVSDIFVMPSWVGLSIVHAFCYHLPIITEKSNLHAPEIQYFHNKYNGLYYEKDNPLSLCNAIYEVLNNRTELMQFKNNAFDTVKNEASIDTMINMFNKAINFKKQL